MIKAVAHVAAMSPYALASLGAPEGKSVISLAQNESLRPPSPGVHEAAARALSAAHLYPDPEWSELRELLSQRHGVAVESILCGCGSMDLIAAIARAFSDPSRSVLAPAHAYPYFRTAAQIARARFDTAPEDGLRVSVDALLAAARPDTALVFVANPANPTGTRIPRSELIRLRQGLPPDVLLVIDEAYGEFADHLNEPMFDLISRRDTIVLRSFSKAYGLAGLRVGWGAFPRDIALELRKVMAPNNISAVSQAAACAALKDQPYLHETCAITATLRDRFRERLHHPDIEVDESFTNFLLLRMRDTALADEIMGALQTEGIVLRPQAGVGLPHCLRMTIGTGTDLDQTADLINSWQGGQLS